jgi:hypothetical protein
MSERSELIIRLSAPANVVASRTDTRTRTVAADRSEATA